MLLKACLVICVDHFFVGTFGTALSGQIPRPQMSTTPSAGGLAGPQFGGTATLGGPSAGQYHEYAACVMCGALDLCMEFVGHMYLHVLTECLTRETNAGYVYYAV